MTHRLSALVAAALLAGCAADPPVEVRGEPTSVQGARPAAVDEPLAPVDESTVAAESEVEPVEAVDPPEREPVAPERWAALLDEIRARFPDVAQLSTAELAEWLDSAEPAPVLLDVREPEEFAVSHLPGALRARDLETARALLADVPPDRPVVLYCSVGYRSSELAAKLARDGRPKLFNLEGSIFTWANEDRALERAGKPAELVHPYDSDWGRLLRRERWSTPKNEEPR